MAYSIYTQAGAQPIDVTSTTKRHPIGNIVRGVDPTYGEGEFIYLLGVDSTVVGSLVTYAATSGLTALTVASTDKFTGVSVAVAMSANVGSQYGWYQIGGLAVIKKTAVAVGPQVKLYLSATNGRVKVLASGGMLVEACKSANLASVTTTTSTVTAQIDRPHIMGPATLA